jgi:hypothetical protein
MDKVELAQDHVQLQAMVLVFQVLLTYQWVWFSISLSTENSYELPPEDCTEGNIQKGQWMRNVTLKTNKFHEAEPFFRR